VNIHQHWLRELVQRNRINIDWVPTANMPADGLTKALPPQKHKKFVEMLGLRDIRTRIEVGNNFKSS